MTILMQLSSYLAGLAHQATHLSILSLIYFPLQIVLMSWFENNFKFSNYRETFSALAKPLFLVSLQSFAIIGMFVTLLIRRAQGAELLSLEIIMDELIFLSAFIYAQLQKNRSPSILMLTFFAIPLALAFILVSVIIYILLAAFFDISLFSFIKLSYFWLFLIDTFIVLIPTTIQALLAKRFTVNFFVELFFANALALYLTKIAIIVLRSLLGLGIGMW